MNTETVIISRADAEEFITKHAQHAILEKWIEKAKPALLTALVAGAVSPPELPFLLVNQPQDKKTPNWQGYALSLLKKLYRSKDREARAQAEIDRVDAAWPKKPTPALRVVINPHYAAKLPAPDVPVVPVDANVP